LIVWVVIFQKAREALPALSVLAFYHWSAQPSFYAAFRAVVQPGLSMNIGTASPVKDQARVEINNPCD
jgi:hypothetical protein